MGFWKSVGKFALWTAAPGVMAGLQMDKARQFKERAEQTDEAIDVFFKNLASIDQSDGWQDVSSLMKKTLIGMLTGKRELLEATLKSGNPNERCRALLGLLVIIADTDPLVDFAKQKKVNLVFLKNLLLMQQAMCMELDKNVAQLSLEPTEHALIRFLFDLTCTRLPAVTLTYLGQCGNDLNKAFNEIMRGVVLPFDGGEREQLLRQICEANKVDMVKFRRKFCP